MNIKFNMSKIAPRIVKRARVSGAARITLSLTALLISSNIYAQSIPSQLRVRVDANNYLILTGLAQTSPISSPTVFTNTRLRTDSNGYLAVVLQGGTISGPIFGPIESSCAIVAYSFTGRTTTGLNSHATNTWNLCGGGILGLSGNTTNITSALPVYNADGTFAAPSYTFTSNTATGSYIGTDTLYSIAGRTRVTAATIHFGESTYNNGQTGLAGVNSLLGQDYARFFANNWGADNGLVIEGRSTTSTSPANPTLEFGARSYNASTWASIQFTGFKASGTGGSYALNALSDTDLFIAFCNNNGSTACDNRVFTTLGNGQITSLINSFSSSAIGATSIYGHSLTNSIPATNGAQVQWSPAYQMCGTAWKTDAATGSQIDCFRIITKPIAAAGVTTATLAFQSSINDGVNTFTDRATLTSAGLYTASTINATSALQQSGVAAALAVAANYKIARGSTALDGSNPTTVATGLTTVVSCTGTLLRTTALTTGTAFLTHDIASGANVDFYGWVIAGTASTGTETFEWVCVGT